MPNNEGSYFDELELSKLAQFAEDEAMFDAVKKAVLAWMYEHGTLRKGKKKEDGLQNFLIVHLSRHPELTNEQVGEHVRAVYQGLNALEVGFESVKKYKRETIPPISTTNNAR
jgi:hypothetical protein